MPDAIVLEEDASQRMLVKALLEAGGVRVADAGTAQQALDLVRGSKARLVITRGAAFREVVRELREHRPGVEVLEPLDYGTALLEGAAGRDALATFARDALGLLVTLVEDHLGVEPQVERVVRMVELTARHVGVGRIEAETASAVATLAALGPHLTKFRYGAETPAGAVAGLSHALRAASAAASRLRAPYPLMEGLEALEERFDGSGRPRGLAGMQIPLAARLVQIPLAYAELTRTRDRAGVDESVVAETLRGQAGSHYDPKLLDAFFQALRDERYLERLSGGQSGPRVLVASADAGVLAVSELRLSAAGFLVETCRDGVEAYDKITQEPHPAAVIADTALPKLDGISLLLKLKRHPTGKTVPLVFTTQQSNPGVVKKALALGAKDVLPAPINYDVLTAKLQTLTAGAETPTDAIVGNLADMPLSDFFQVLALGRRTARIEVTGAGDARGDVYFEQGVPSAAITPRETGVEAFCRLVLLKQGTFRLFPSQTAEERNLKQNLESLLLHVAWLEDEAGRDG